MIEADDQREAGRDRLASMRRWNLLTWILWVGYTHLLVFASTLIYGNAGGVGPVPLIGFAENLPDRPDANGVIRLKIRSDRPASGVLVEIAGDAPGGTVQAGKDYKIRQPKILLPMDGGKADAVVDVLDNVDRTEGGHLRLTLMAVDGGRIDPARSNWTVFIPATKSSRPERTEVSFSLPKMEVVEGGRVRAELSITPEKHPVQTVDYSIDSRFMAPWPIRADSGREFLEFDLPTDNVYTGDRKVVVALREGPRVRVGKPSTLEITVRDKDPRPIIRVVQERDVVAEGAGLPLSFRLKIEGASTTGEVSIRCKVVDRSPGLSIRDPDQVLTFRSGERERNVAIAVVDDREKNADRGFAVELSDAKGAQLEPATSKLRFTIKDDDGIPGRVLLVVVHNSDFEQIAGLSEKIKAQLSLLLGVKRFQGTFLRDAVVAVRRDGGASAWDLSDALPGGLGRPFRSDEPIEDSINAALDEARRVEKDAVDPHFAVFILWPTREKPGAIAFNPGKIRSLEGHPTRVFGLGASLIEFRPLREKFDGIFGTGTARSYDAADLDTLEKNLGTIVSQFIVNSNKP